MSCWDPAAHTASHTHHTHPTHPTLPHLPPACPQSIDALAEALEEFEGGVVVISHDARLLSRICDDAEAAEVWIVEDGEVHPWDGDFEDYKDELIKEIAKEMDEQEAEEARRQVCAGRVRGGSLRGWGERCVCVGYDLPLASSRVQQGPETACSNFGRRRLALAAAGGARREAAACGQEVRCSLNN